MHDVIRDMGLWIACELEVKENKFFVKEGAQLFEESNVKVWEGAKRISVMQNQIEVLRGTPKCPNLRTLFLSSNCKLKVMSDSFFRFMPYLTVLNLSNNWDLLALPVGISQLTSLECLDLSWTGITELPIELKYLTKLKMLDLSFMRYLRKIPQYLISSFSKLQIFRINSVPRGDSIENLIEELNSLQHLNRVRIPVTSMIGLERFLSLHLLPCCTEALVLTDFRDSNEFNVLCLENMECLESLEIHGFGNIEEMKMVKLHPKVSPSTNYASLFQFHTLREVSIRACNNLRDVTWLILAPNLRSLGIFACEKMVEILSKGKLREVADVVGIPYPTPFLKLEALGLYYLQELKSLYWDALPFPCLKKINVLGCPKLKKLPLNSDSAKGNHITIKGKKDWWAKLEWENGILPSSVMFTDYQVPEA